MANRRMFSKDIVRSDAFLDLSISSQALYFHLGMEADDRGYINNPKSVIRSIGATWGDLEQLANRRFIMIREEGLILIKGWRINNSIQPTRLVESKFIYDLKNLFFDENNSYTEKQTEKPVLNICRQSADKLSTQDSIGKVSIDGINNDIPLFCESCFQKLLTQKYLELKDYADKDRYLEMFNILLKGYTRKNICISLNYALYQIGQTEWDENKQRTVHIGIRKDIAIGDKYAYLREALYSNCERFKDGYDAYYDKRIGWLDKVLEVAKKVYQEEDSKYSALTDQRE